MFLGHFAVGLASKRVAPKASLGALLAAPLLLDLLWPIFLIVGVESVRIDPGNTAVTPLDLHDYPYSHSLVMSLAWSLLYGALYWAVARYRRGALVIAAGVFSHFLFDFVTHRPDLPLHPGSARSIGLGLWNSRAGTLLVELALYFAGVAVYARATRARNRRGAIGFWSFVLVPVLIYLASFFGPPPPSPAVIEYAALTAWLFVVWAWWLDRNRAVVAHGATSAARRTGQAPSAQS